MVIVSEDWKDFRTGTPHACADYGVSKLLQPGEALRAPEFEVRVPVIDILGTTLPAGRYTVTARLGLNDRQTHEIDAGEVLLSADL